MIHGHVMKKQQELDIQNLNTFSLPCVARELVYLDSADEVQPFFEASHLKPGDYLILGGGSNVLLPKYLNKTVLSLRFSETSYTELDNGEVLVEVESGKAWDALVAETVEKGLIGLENLSYIPGLVGAAPVQNIGAYGVELADVLERVRVYDVLNNSIRELDNSECLFSYRDSVFKRDLYRYCILSITLRLSLNAPFKLNYGELKTLDEIDKQLTPALVRKKVIEVRKAKLPEPDVTPNVGSFFKNPIVSNETLASLQEKFPEMVSYSLDDERSKLAAAWLIDQTGWKGLKAGAVGVHDKQALVLVNNGGAELSDVLSLASQIQESIYSTYSVQLEVEPSIIES